VDSARQVLTELAGSARVAAEHASRIDQPIDQDPDLAELRPDAARLADRQQRAIGHLRRLLTDADTAARTLAEARRLTASLDAEANDLATRRADRRHGGCAHTAPSWPAAVRGHLERAVELRLPDPAATLAELELVGGDAGWPEPGRQRRARGRPGRLHRAGHGGRRTNRARAVQPGSPG